MRSSSMMRLVFGQLLRWRVLAGLPGRLFNLPSFLMEQQLRRGEFMTGDVVRAEPMPNAEMFLGEKRMKGLEFTIGSAEYSFFEARDPWEIVEIETSYSWNAVLYLCGLDVEHPSLLTLRQRTGRVFWGKNILKCIPGDQVEKVPAMKRLV